MEHPRYQDTIGEIPKRMPSIRLAVENERLRTPRYPKGTDQELQSKLAAAEAQLVWRRAAEAATEVGADQYSTIQSGAIAWPLVCAVVMVLGAALWWLA